MKPKLIIFDCDGVLVDTESIANEHIARFFSRQGSQLTGAECRKIFQGKTLEDVCRHFTEMNGSPDDPKMPGELRNVIEEAMSNGIEAIPGAVKLVSHIIGKGMPVCVASSGSVPKMHKTLSQVGLLEPLKDVLFSAQDFGRGKPHPDVFLAAANAMGHSCKDAVIVEDSLSGVQAGIAAGATVLGYAGDPFTDAQVLANAGAKIFTDMNEVPNIIGL